MHNVSPDQWRAWRENPVTKLLAGEIQRKVKEGLNLILSSTDSEFDKIAKGKIFGYQDILEWEPDFEGESQADDQV